MAPEELTDQPVWRIFDPGHFILGGGVAIFHLATSRVVVIRHSREKYWFLPKGRRDAGEESAAGAEREGFEESGYRNRLLPIPIAHRQPRAHNSDEARDAYVTEPIQTQLFPYASNRRMQYIVYWYVAETVPPDVEEEMNAAMATKATQAVPTPYIGPPRFPKGLSLADRIKMDEPSYEPKRHLNTGVDEDEALYESHLLPIDEALQKLRNRTSAEIIRAGWEAICLRREMEAKSTAS